MALIAEIDSILEQGQLDHKALERLVDATKEAVIELGDAILKKQYRGSENPMTGHCYAASDALYWMLGGKEAGWKPMGIRHEDASHWYLKHVPTGTIVDATSAQFCTPVPHAQGRGRGFPRPKIGGKLGPGKAAQQIIKIVEKKLGGIPRVSALAEGLDYLVEAQKVELVVSPGRGPDSYGKGGSRLQIVDSSAPPADKNDTHFFYKERLRTRGRNGKPLKRPKKVLMDPGADDGVVAFTDYNLWGKQIRIELIIVRDDYRRKGLAKKLLDELVKKHKSVEIFHFGKLLNPASMSLKGWMAGKYPDKSVIGAKFF